ncbi:MAG: nucleotide exchange factor GrpE [Chromatocurvus sp.]
MAEKDQEADRTGEHPEATEAQAEATASSRAAAGETDAAATSHGVNEAAEALHESTDEPSADQEVARLQEEVAQAKDSAMRAQAEAQNSKRRAEQEVEKARKYALERFVGELLPVVDNLERALESASGDEEVVKPIAEGVELTLKSFQNALHKYNVEEVDPQGEPFDPQLHQAMSQVENPDVEPNTVIAVMQKGYTLNGRLVRPAMVMVSKQAEGGGRLDERA